MTSTELLLVVVHNVALANELAAALVKSAGEREVLTVGETGPTIFELDRVLREASVAAAALRSRAAGNPEPKRGD